MNDYLLLMHADATSNTTADQWQPYIASLREAGAFVGGSSFGAREPTRKNGITGTIGASLAGYIHVRAANIGAAKALVPGNPDYESGATVEVVELIRD